MTLLSLQNISKNYNSNIGNFEVFKEINFEINENENVFLFGPSGCGKSSLLNIISGLDKPEKGEIFFLNKKLSNNHHSFLKNDIGIIFQDHYLISELNLIFHYLAYPCVVNHIKNLTTFHQKTLFDFCV